MLDIGAWGELIIIMILALVIIGPKDLPKMFQLIGRWAGKMRQWSYDIHNAVTVLTHETHPFDEPHVVSEDVAKEPHEPKEDKQEVPQVVALAPEQFSVDADEPDMFPPQDKKPQGNDG